MLCIISIPKFIKSLFLFEHVWKLIDRNLSCKVWKKAATYKEEQNYDILSQIHFTWNRPDKLLSICLFGGVLFVSLFWELKYKRNLTNLQFCSPQIKSLRAMLE